jgi:hypothetical protein
MEIKKIITTYLTILSNHVDFKWKQNFSFVYNLRALMYMQDNSKILK